MTITLPEVDHEVDTAIEQLITDLENARDYIDKHGLAKRQFFSVFTNARCMDGAIMTAIGRAALGNPRRDRALYALASTLGADLSTVGVKKAVYDFNDSPLTEQADVIGIFNTTIDRLRA
jgi:hypothetical protein